MPRWSSGRKCDCRTRGLGFDSRVGQSITGPFSDFRNMGLITQMCAALTVVEFKAPTTLRCSYVIVEELLSSQLEF
ncbi:hypothetical protein SFRURICE_010355 [Spodoptera frugiperda]|nr:hypothetical protein SFRURICE_010355 [Spodoptera frugiperda]